MLRDKIQEEMIVAMKNRSEVRLAALRYMWSEIRNAEIDKKSELSDEEVERLVKKEVKKREEGVEQLEKAGRQDGVREEEAKLAVLKEFMMEQLGDEEIAELVRQVQVEGVKEFGEMMKRVMGLTGGKAEGKRVNRIVQEMLGGRERGSNSQ